MTRLLVVFILAFLLSVSPILPSIAACACCYDAEDEVSGLPQEHAHAEAHALADASHPSGDGRQHHWIAHHEHGADAASGLDVATSAHPGVSAPNSCSCDQGDDPVAQTAAISQLSPSSRKFTQMTSGHLVSAFKVAEERLSIGTYFVDVGGVPPPAADLFLLHRALLI